MLDEASHARDAVSLNSRPLFPPTVLDTADRATVLDAADRDADVDADEAGAPLQVATQEDVDHPSCRSMQDEAHQDRWDLRP